MVAGAISVPGLGPRSGSVVRVKVVIVGVVTLTLVGIVGIISDHHVLSVDPGRVANGQRPRHRAYLRRAAGDGDPRGPPGRGWGRVVGAAEDDHGAASFSWPPPVRPVPRAVGQDGVNLPVVLPCQPPPERTSSSILSASFTQETAEEVDVRSRQRQAGKAELLHGQNKLKDAV